MRVPRAGAFECFANVLLLEPANVGALESVAALHARPGDDAAPPLCAANGTLQKLRRRIETRTQRGEHAQATAYSEALALLERRDAAPKGEGEPVAAPA
jgi:hypothetical protein